MSPISDGTPIRQAVPSYGTVDSGDISRSESFVIDANPPLIPKKMRRTPSRWYLAYYVPSLEWARKYSWSALPGDICSGITLASFQIPVSLSYATTLANIDAVCGLYGLIVAPLVYALLGSVPVMVVAPEGPISLIIGKLSPPYFVDHPAHGRSALDPEQISALVAGTAGAVILFLGLIRTGFLTSVLSQSLLRGFVTGVGTVMIADQLPAMLGMSAAMHRELGLDASSFDKARYTWSHWREARPVESWFSLSALAALLLFKAVKRFLIDKRGYKRAVLIPDILTVVMVSTAVCKLGGFYTKTGGRLAVIGDVSADNMEFLWMLRPKYWKDFKINFQSSFFIGILGLLESTVAARLLGSSSPGVSEEAGIRGSNRELVALGAANVIGSIFGSLPAFGGYGRSKINILSGGTTQMSGIISALVTLICTYKLMGLVYYLPRCTLSAVIASIGINLIEEAPKEVKFFWKVRSYSDLATMFLSLLVTFFWSVEAGVSVGAGVAFIRVVHHATRPRIQILARDPQTHHFINAAELQDNQTISDSSVLVAKIPEPLTFANSSLLEDMLKRLERHGTTRVHPGQPRTRQEQIHTIVFHLKGMTECDAGAAATLKSIIAGYLSRGIRVIFTGVVAIPELQQMLRRSGIMEMLESQPYNESVFPNVPAAIESLD